MTYAISLKIIKLYVLFLLIPFFGNSQNIKMEVLEYPKYIKEKKCATYHFAQSSYSASSPYTLLILNIDDFLATYPKIKIEYEKKQGFTDVYLLGIDGFNPDNITESNLLIIENLYNEINKYRECNNLEKLDKKYFDTHKHFYKNEKGFGKFLSY